MPDLSSPAAPSAVARGRPLFSKRKIVHMSMLIFAFLLPFLTWPQAVGCAGLALLFNVFILPRLGVDLRKRPAAAGDDESQSSVLSGAENVWTGIVIYPVSVLVLILLYRNNMHIEIGRASCRERV